MNDDTKKPAPDESFLTTEDGKKILVEEPKTDK